MQAADGESFTAVLKKDINPSELVLTPVERFICGNYLCQRCENTPINLLTLPSVMFWMDAGHRGRVTIERSWMDGSERRSLAVLTAQVAHSLAADVAARRLYWISDVQKVCPRKHANRGGDVTVDAYSPLKLCLTFFRF